MKPGVWLQSRLGFSPAEWKESEEHQDLIMWGRAGAGGKQGKMYIWFLVHMLIIHALFGSFHIVLKYI
uniref:Uncharacterized protein n=1 Tax=Kangiella spongicola TaxID=796379 RepID=A0A318D4Y7_9GAMM